MIDDILCLPDWISRLKESDCPIIMYGTGNGADKIKAKLDECGIYTSAVAVSDGFAHGKRVYGHTTVPLSQIQRENARFTCVLCFGTEGAETAFVRDLAHRQTVICPDAPIYGDEWQTKLLLSAEQDDIMRVYDLLGDDISRQIFRQNLAFSVTGDVCLLNDIVGGEMPVREYFTHEKAHIDVGAFDGDTAKEYAAMSASYGNIIAVEPDEITYKKLIKNTSALRDMRCINAAAGNFCGEVGFAGGKGRGSHLLSGKGCRAVTVDSIADRRFAFRGGMPVGSIKIDAEGMDMAVLEGAVNTICDERPVLAVSVYHRAGDIWRIPLYLHRLCGKYIFFLRRKAGLLPAWDTVVYAVPRI